MNHLNDMKDTNDRLGHFVGIKRRRERMYVILLIVLIIIFGFILVRQYIHALTDLSVARRATLKAQQVEAGIPQFHVIITRE